MSQVRSCAQQRSAAHPAGRRRRLGIRRFRPRRGGACLPAPATAGGLSWPGVQFPKIRFGATHGCCVYATLLRAPSDAPCYCDLALIRRCSALLSGESFIVAANSASWRRPPSLSVWPAGPRATGWLTCTLTRIPVTSESFPWILRRIWGASWRSFAATALLSAPSVRMCFSNPMTRLARISAGGVASR